MNEFLERLEEYAREDKKKVWIRECNNCGFREEFKRHPNQYCPRCEHEVMRVFRDSPKWREEKDPWKK